MSETLQQRARAMANYAIFVAGQQELLRALADRLDALEAELAQHERCIEEIQAAELQVAERENELHDEKDRRIKMLEAALADAEHAYTDEKEERGMFQGALAEAQAENVRLRAGLHDAEAIGDFSDELRDRLALKEAAACVPTLQAELAQAKVDLKVAREENARLLAERPTVQREAFRAGYTAPGYGNAEAEAQARRRYPDLPAEKQA